MPKDEGAEPVLIFAGSLMESDFVKSLLDAEGIPAYVLDRHTATLDLGYDIAMGGVKVVVAARDAKRAGKVVQDFIDNRA